MSTRLDGYYRPQGRILVPMHPWRHKFLRFVWEGRCLQFCTLCFGLLPAPQVFTCIVAPVAVAMHQCRVRLLLYLDDWLLLTPSQQDTSVRALLQLCAHVGLRVNYKQSHLIPTQTVRMPVFPTQGTVASLLSVLTASGPALAHQPVFGCPCCATEEGEMCDGH